jgi:3-phenylpropionate/trans-cinnamate dioxygenase ferredoxin reductase subunit
MSDHIVIVGAGQAGLTTAQALRERAHRGPITLVGDEPRLPYQRPPLSKSYLAGDLTEDRLFLKPPAFFTQHDIALRRGARARRIDRATGRIEHDGGRISYDRLVLATGTRARTLPIPGVDLEGVHTLRAVPDVDVLRPTLTPGTRLVVIGGGYIGLEVAAVAAKRGLNVTIVEAASRVMARVVAPPVSAFYEALHRANGVTFHLATGVSEITRGSGALRVATTGETEIACDRVLVSIGAVPNVELAAEAGLRVDNGILVDEATRSSDPAILSCGDATRFPSPRYGRHVRLESVQNAIDQAKAAAATLTGSPVVYDPVPWFWSDQYDVKLQIAGLSEGHDRAVERRAPESRARSVFYLRGDVLLAVDSIDQPRDHMLARRAIGRRIALTDAQLADPGRPWQDHLLD